MSCETALEQTPNGHSAILRSNLQGSGQFRANLGLEVVKPIIVFPFSKIHTSLSSSARLWRHTKHTGLEACVRLGLWCGKPDDAASGVRRLQFCLARQL